MSILKEMQALMSKTPPVISGRVETLGSNSITVVSQQGVRSFWVPSVGVYKIGDPVRFQGEVLLGRTASEIGIPTYMV